MSNPTNPERPTPASRAPKSGRKHIDPTKYQMDTVPTELVAKIAELRRQPLPQAVLHPPPLFDERPIIGRLRRAGEWIARRRKWLAIGCLVGLCVVVTMTVMMSGKTTAKPSASARSIPVQGVRPGEAVPERAPPQNQIDVPKPEVPSSPQSEHVSGSPIPAKSPTNVKKPITSQPVSNSPQRSERAVAPPNSGRKLRKAPSEDDPDAPIVPP